MPSLQRIILIDTHLPGVVELKLTGHTNICGTNASGKTTLQRLIPVFYGEFPSRVVPATRDSFEKWYLPRESSFIVYEYQRSDESLYQTVLASSGNGVNYRLIGKAFDLADYLEPQVTGEHKSITMVELGRNMKRANVPHTSLINTSQYRAIIQNDRSQLNSSANSRELLGFARLFSLCESDASLRHIEKLAKAVHSKEGKMETIKTMVAAILEEDGVQPPSSNLNLSKVDEWIKECQLIQSFNLIRPEFAQLEQSHIQINSNEARLAELKQHLSLDMAQLSKTIIQSQGELEELQLNLRQVETKWGEQRDEYNQVISSAKADTQKYEADLEKVEQQYQDWQDKDIDALQNKITELSRWQNELQTAQSRYQLLTEKHSDIEAAYNKRLAEISEKYSQEIEIYHDEKDDIKEQISEQRQKEQNQLQQLKNSYQQQIQRIESDFKDAIHELDKEQAELKSDLKHTSFNSHEQSELDLVDAQIKEASYIEDTSRDALQAANQVLKQAQDKRKKADDTLAKARQQVTKKHQAVETIEASLYPGQNTLLEFLRREQPNWEQNLGKVIHPDLLKRNDLSPETTLSQSDLSLYGVCLNLAGVDTPEYAQSEQAIKVRLEDAQIQLETANQHQTQAEDELEKANQAVVSAEQSVNQINNECNQKSQSRKRLQQERELLVNQFQQMVGERKLSLEKRLEQNNQAKNRQKEELQACRDEIEAQRAEAELEHQAHWQQLLSELQQKLIQIDSRIQQSQQSQKLDKKQSEVWLADELSNRGVDVDDISKLKKQIKQLQQDIDYTERNRNLVNDYQHWYETIFNGHKVSWQQGLTEAKQALLDAERSLSKTSAEYQSSRQVLVEQQTGLEQNLRQAKQQEIELQAANKQLSKLKLPPVDLVGEVGNIGQRVSEVQSLLEDREQLLASIKSHIDHFDSLIASQAGTGLAEIWEKSRDECGHVNAQGMYSIDHRKLVDKLAQLLNVVVPQKVQALREQGKIFGKDLTSYYQVLADIDKRIVSQSSRISREVDEELFLDGISDSAVKIRSKISELEFWPDLQQFNQYYQTWIETGAHELPDKDYALSMRRALDIIGRAALSGGISKLLDIELRINESGKDLVIRTDRQLNESSSHGMAYLILCKFLLAFTRLLRGKSVTTIHWPIDELGTLHQSNIKKIFTACEKNHIAIVGAFPNPESEVLSLFDNRYLIDRATKKLQTVTPRVNPITDRIKAKKAVVSPTQTEQKDEAGAEA
ncbi:ATP-binding protein [Catenovulum maritimum]|uniref:ATP-binding protein n=1 Tax=Catenovulum maritimum TaxID=1513271 RepID=A0A0J8GTG2_9ALTE|nr:ATP-binding protein [Catenovulum maritimum]KMT63998.1 hypothetical protein XM47_16505 [Catenovulum maritimum]